MSDECTCPYTDPSTWLSAASCGYGSGYEPGSMQEWDPDCPVHFIPDPPKRIQRKRTKGWRMPEGVIYVGRGSRWGNPWIVDPTRATKPATNQYRDTVEECVRLYRDLVRGRDDLLAPLRGRDLACWCPLDQPCHADVLLEFANALPVLDEVDW